MHRWRSRCQISEEEEPVASSAEKPQDNPEGGPAEASFPLGTVEEVLSTGATPLSGQLAKKRRGPPGTRPDGKGADLHLSLCRTFMLQHHLIGPFIEKLSEKLQPFST